MLKMSHRSHKLENNWVSWEQKSRSFGHCSIGNRRRVQVARGKSSLFACQSKRMQIYTCFGFRWDIDSLPRILKWWRPYAISKTWSWRVSNFNACLFWTCCVHSRNVGLCRLGIRLSWYHSFNFTLTLLIAC